MAGDVIVFSPLDLLADREPAMNYGYGSTTILRGKVCEIHYQKSRLVLPCFQQIAEPGNRVSATRPPGTKITPC